MRSSEEIVNPPTAREPGKMLGQSHVVMEDDPGDAGDRGTRAGAASEAQREQLPANEDRYHRGTEAQRTRRP